MSTTYILDSNLTENSPGVYFALVTLTLSQYDCIIKKVYMIVTA